MTLPIDVSKVGAWMRADSAPDGDVVVSSRVRLARNLADVPFPHIAEESVQEEIRETVERAVAETKNLKDAKVIHIEDIDNIERQVLIERHLINQRILDSKRASVLVGDSEILSVMVNEEDHLRIQAIEPGLAMIDTWRIVDTLDNELEAKLPYAFRSEIGYCTACPTNVGTGMRASVLVHLPGLVDSKQFDKVHKAVSHLGLTVRGYYGEGTDPISNFLQISNNITLSNAEEEIVDNIEKITRQIASKEREARKYLFSEQNIKLEDSIFRAYGILRYARRLKSKEAMNLLSSIRLGVYFKLIKDVSMQILNELTLLIQPAHLCVQMGRELSPDERDVARADLIRRRLGVAQ